MHKKKSVKNISKTLNPSQKKNQGPLPVKQIMKEIGELKRELVSIKSKKDLRLATNFTLKQQSNKQNILQYSNDDDTPSKNRAVSTNVQLLKTKQICKENFTCYKCEQRLKQSKALRKIQLHQIEGPKSRQLKLKLNMQINKIKNQLQKLQRQNECWQNVVLIASQLNTGIMITDSIIKQYQEKWDEQNENKRKMQEQLQKYDKKLRKQNEKNHQIQNINMSHINQIKQLKRHLSYYMEVMEENKKQCQQLTNQSNHTEIYIKQLQHNNNHIKTQLQTQINAYSLLKTYSEQCKQQIKMLQNSLIINKEQLNLINISYQVSVKSGKQVQKSYLLLLEQQKEYKNKNIKYNNDIRQLQQKQKLHIQQIQNFKQQILHLKQLVSSKQNHIIQINNQNRHFTQQIQQNQQLNHSLQQQIKTHIQNLQKQIKSNLSLTSDNLNLQMEIENLSQQIHNLQKSNQNYKNKYFRSKLIHENSNNQIENSQNKVGKYKSQKLNLKNVEITKNQKKQKAMNQILELVSYHKRQSSSSSDNQQI